RRDVPNDPQNLFELRSLSIQVAGYGESPYFLFKADLNSIPKPTPEQKETNVKQTRLGMMASSYPEQFDILIDDLERAGVLTPAARAELELLKTDPGHVLSAANFDATDDEIQGVAARTLAGDQLAAHQRTLQMIRMVEAWANQRLQSGFANITQAFKLREVYRHHINRIVPEMPADEVEALLDERVQFAMVMESVGNNLLNFLRTYYRDTPAATLETQINAWQTAGDLAPADADHLRGLIAAYRANPGDATIQTIDLYLNELANTTTPTTPEQEAMVAAMQVWGANSRRTFNLSLNEYMDLLGRGPDHGGIGFPPQTATAKLGNYLQVRKLITTIAGKARFLRGGRDNTSIVHAPPAKYAQWIPSFLYYRENVLLLDWDMRHYMHETFFLPNAVRAMFDDPRLALGPYGAEIYTRPLSTVANAAGLFEEGWVNSTLQVKRVIGQPLAYGKILATTSGLENLWGLLSDLYVAEDAVGAMATLKYGLRSTAFGYVIIGKGLGNMLAEMLKPFRKWSGDEPEIKKGTLTSKYNLSPGVHWTSKADNDDSLGFYEKKPAVRRVTIMVLLVFYFLDLNPWFGLPVALFINSVLVAQAIGLGAGMLYVRESGWILGTLRYLKVIVGGVFVLATTITPQYADAVYKGFRKWTRFVLTGGKGGPLSRAVFEELYISGAYSIVPGVLLTIVVLFFSSFDPIKFAIWAPQILTVSIGWWMGFFLLNPNFSMADRAETAGQVIISGPTWAILDAINSIPRWFKPALLTTGVLFLLASQWMWGAVLVGGALAIIVGEQASGRKLVSFSRLFGYDRKIYNDAMKMFREADAGLNKGAKPFQALPGPLKEQISYHFTEIKTYAHSSGVFNTMAASMEGKATYQAIPLLQMMKIDRHTAALEKLIAQATNQPAPSGLVRSARRVAQNGLVWAIEAPARLIALPVRLVESALSAAASVIHRHPTAVAAAASVLVVLLSASTAGAFPMVAAGQVAVTAAVVKTNFSLWWMLPAVAAFAVGARSGRTSRLIETPAPSPVDLDHLLTLPLDQQRRMIVELAATPRPLGVASIDGENATGLFQGDLSEAIAQKVGAGIRKERAADKRAAADRILVNAAEAIHQQMFGEGENLRASSLGAHTEEAALAGGLHFVVRYALDADAATKIRYALRRASDAGAREMRQVAVVNDADRDDIRAQFAPEIAAGQLLVLGLSEAAGVENILSAIEVAGMAAKADLKAAQFSFFVPAGMDARSILNDVSTLGLTARVYLISNAINAMLVEVTLQNVDAIAQKFRLVQEQA
ncbi:MAG: hypothetical protein JO102_01225, partial [Elusimicrobia bacterium]|nr:hypothetical protein [Elusimicrobiota bacterium]